MKRRRWLIIIALFVAVLVGSGLWLALRPPAKTEEAPTAAAGPASWRGVVPGLTSPEQVFALLGQPAATSVEPSGTTYFFSSANQYWKNEVRAREATVAFVKEYVFPPADTSLLSTIRRFNVSPTRLFGPDSVAGRDLFVSPERGVALFANGEKDKLYEVWYFPPVSLEQFLQFPEASGYSRQRPQRSDI